MNRAGIRRSLRRLDWGLTAVVAALLALGIAFIYSAGAGHPASAARALHLKQLCWAGLGTLFYFGFALLDYHGWVRRAWWLYLAGLVLLALVFVPHVGVRVYGARRWLAVAGFRVLQPAELVKLAVILVLARLFGWPGRNLRRARYRVAGLLLVLLPAALIARQPDLGTALMLPPVLLIMMWSAGVSARWLASVLAAVVLVAGAVCALIVAPPALGMEPARHERLLARAGISPYQRDRVLVFLDRDRDPLGAGWNKMQSQIAIGSGRLWGKGYCQGTQNLLGFLPRTVAPNDFIFSVIAEETGFAGSALTLTCFGLMLAACLRAAANAADAIGRLLCVGVAALLFSHVAVNIAMTIGLLPVTGLPLPLLSYGGTFMIGTMTALGIVQSVRIRGDWR